MDISDDTIFDAMDFRKEHAGMSYLDCIGYKVAEREGIKFLTGNRHFEDLKNVEFVR